jgi:hypothetical protein
LQELLKSFTDLLRVLDNQNAAGSQRHVKRSINRVKVPIQCAALHSEPRQTCARTILPCKDQQLGAPTSLFKWKRVNGKMRIVVLFWEEQPLRGEQLARQDMQKIIRRKSCNSWQVDFLKFS